ncbi:MAG: MaoC family dehydratase [Geminicoccaceae bacterium]|nr:MaoC family dehydratase [Geminicoccaceae bacterium]
MSKTAAGNFFEDFEVGRVLHHPTPRTVTEGDAALYLALTGSRFAINCSNMMARSAGLPRPPLDDLLTFHLALGRSVPDVSLNAVANLGYADGRFGALLYPGDTLLASSEVLGVKENSSGRAGTAWVRTRAQKDDGREILSYVRWVMIKKRDSSSPAPEPVIPELPDHVPAERIAVPPGLRPRHFDRGLSGSMFRFESYVVGERIDHVDGMTVEEADHRTATRLYQNPAKVHFDHHREKDGRLGRCIVYGGHVLSIARALSFNGLGNVLHIAAINGGTHANPCVAGDTIYAWSEVLDKADLPGHPDLGALRLRLVATRNRPCEAFPLRDESGRYEEDVLLDFDYWGIMPR